MSFVRELKIIKLVRFRELTVRKRLEQNQVKKCDSAVNRDRTVSKSRVCLPLFSC